MGEFAEYQGDRIKIGTCEDMYYLRADQRHLISGYAFTLDIDRFRFPFPDEDDIEPGCFGDHNRGIEIPDFTLEPGYFEHAPGCEESRVQLMQQGFRGDDGEAKVLASIVGCVGCGHKGWLIPEVAKQAIISFRLAGENEIADRIAAGYQLHSVAA